MVENRLETNLTGENGGTAANTPWFDEAMAYLRECEAGIFYDAHYFASVDSTNEVVKRAAAKGAPEGYLAVGEEQTAGKGRLGRAWKSPAGESIYFSFLLRPTFSPEHASMLTLVMGLSVAQAVRELYALAADIKWPNDIVINRKKICGILTEAIASGGQLEGVVIGTGVNVNNAAFPEEIADRATSLYLERGKDASRALLLAHILRRFHKNYGTFLETENLASLRRDYDFLLVSRDQQVRIEDPAGAYTGISRGIDEGGRLIVELPDGSETAVSSGEVSVRGLYGYI